MNIVRKNFCEKLPEILKRISKAEFVSLDLEFTGLPHKDCYNMVSILYDFFSSNDVKFLYFKEMSVLVS